MAYDYYHDPQNGYVHEDEVDSIHADYNQQLDMLNADYQEAVSELAHAEDALYAVQLLAAREVTPMGGGIVYTQDLFTVLHAYTANDKDFLHSIACVADQGWDQ